MFQPQMKMSCHLGIIFQVLHAMLKTQQYQLGTYRRKQLALMAQNRVVASQGLRSSVMVSPTLASATLFTPALIKPTSPGPNWSTISGSGPKIPTRSTTCVAPEPIMRIFIPFWDAIFDTHQSHNTKIRVIPAINKAFSGALISPSGDGKLVTIASSTSGIPMPVLADTAIASDASRPMTSSTCALTRSGSAAANPFYLTL